MRGTDPHVHIRRTRASPAIDAMTIDQRKWPTLQHVSCPAANASTSELHKICLAQSNHELTRMNTNSNILASTGCQPVGFGCQPKRTFTGPNHGFETRSFPISLVAHPRASTFLSEIRAIRAIRG